jgi:hypothetical protein
MTTVDLPLLPLGRGTDLASERGVECPGDLPSASDPDLVERARAAKAALGDRVFVLGHHYQRDEVIQFADVTGDSFKLARDAAARPEAEYIVFCGVHFMAESADILTSPSQRVVLPDLAAGCSMADMAVLSQVETAWDRRSALGVVLAAHGYPDEPRKGDPIAGIPAAADDCRIFHAGTRLDGKNLVTVGGRVLCVTALGDSVRMARTRAYEAVDRIRFDGMQYRKDIGHRGLKRL